MNNFITKILSSLKFIYTKSSILCYDFYIWASKNNWHMSKNKNFYNPTLQATVYRWGDNWNIARHDIHYNEYDSKNSAMQAAFEMWLKDKQKI